MVVHFVDVGGTLLELLVAVVAEHAAGDLQGSFFVHFDQDLALGGEVEAEDEELVHDDLAASAGA